MKREEDEPKRQEKRRRVTRACDNCRQKKVKCDGKQPCIHCTVYSYICTYDQPNIRNKNLSILPQTLPMPQAFKKKSTLHPNLIMCQNIINVLVPKLKLNVLSLPLNFDFDKFQKAAANNVDLGKIQDTYLLKNNFSQNNDDNVQFDKHNLQFDNYKNSQFDYSKRDSIVSDDLDMKLDLPPKSVALELIYTTWDKACVLFRFYHRPSLLEEVDLIYSLEPYQYTDKQQKFLPFLYSILACGSLFSKSNLSTLSENSNLDDDGFKYFLEARKLIDIPNVTDIPSIQTIVMMIMYLQCSARLSTCYSYIGIALRSALKEGLHRNLIFSSKKLNLIEIDTRKRLFYTIYKMDIYINSLLGLPRSINEDEFDQDFPEDLDDNNITKIELNFNNQSGKISSSSCANHHTKLMIILSHIIKKLYPIKVKKSLSEPLTPDNIHQNVTELELELKNWLDKLPIELKPQDPSQLNNLLDIPKKFILANYYIHLAFLNCQIMLYRPFIHFVSNGNITTSDPRSLIRGRNCIKVARTVVKLANKMIDQNLLIGTYWFSMYTIFFSIACLIYYYHFATNNPNSLINKSIGVNYAGILFDDDLNIDMIKNDIKIGKKVLDNLKNNSNTSLRIYNILNTLFEQLNRRTASKTRIRNDFDNINNNVPDFDNINLQSNSIPQTPVNLNLQNYGNTKENLNQNYDIKQENSPNDHSYQDQYVPGVFDKLDAQIFGKILPPYMLEKNYLIQKSQLNSPGDELENPHMSLDPEDISRKIGSDGLNLDKIEGFDLLAFGDQDLEYLDPFNPSLDMNFNPDVQS